MAARPALSHAQDSMSARNSLNRPVLMAGVVILLAMVAATLAVPLITGWMRPSLGRAAVLERAQKRADRGVEIVQAKYITAADLEAAFPEDPSRPGNLWVVLGVSNNPSPCVVTCDKSIWSGEVFDDRGRWVSSIAQDTGAMATFVTMKTRFDRIKDRVPPTWWLLPVVSSGWTFTVSWPDIAARVVLVLVVLTALAAASAVARGVRLAVSRSAGGRGRPT